jgi:hypothetical protein
MTSLFPDLNHMYYLRNTIFDMVSMGVGVVEWVDLEDEALEDVAMMDELVASDSGLVNEVVEWVDSDDEALEDVVMMDELVIVLVSK